MVRVRATVKLSAPFFHDESSITKGGGDEIAIIARLILKGHEQRLKNKMPMQTLRSRI